MDVNEEADILSRLGILDSKLECPRKQFASPESEKKSRLDKKASLSSSTRIELAPGDGWSGLSSEMSSSSSDSDCLFDTRQDRLSTSKNGIGGAARRRLRRPRHDGSRNAEHKGTPNCWKLVALVSIAAFLGLILPLKHQFLASYSPLLSQFLVLHALCMWIGSTFASFSLLRINPYSVLLSVMFVFVCALAQLQMAASAPLASSTALLFFAAQALVAGTIERAILLVAPLWSGGQRQQRTLFTCYAAMALAAAICATLQNQSTPASILSEADRTRREIGIGENATGEVPSFLQFGGLNSENRSLQGLLAIAAESNGYALNTTLDQTTTAAASKSVEQQGDPPVFKSKTEENAYMRKEVERKQKEKQKQQQLEEQEATRHTTTPSSTTIKTTTPSSTGTTTTTSTTSSTTTTALPPMQANVLEQPKPTTNSSAPISNMASAPQRLLLPTLHLALLCVLLLPLLLGFCCCCALDHPVCSTHYAHMDELLSPLSAQPETALCKLLAMSICALHSAIAVNLDLAAPALPSLQSAPNLAPITLFWLALGAGRLLVAIKPSLTLQPGSLHFLYCVSLCACTILHLFLPTTTFTLLIGLAISGLAANIPLLLYAWQCSVAHSAQMGASARFILAMAIGQLGGPAAFAWLNAGETADTQQAQLDNSSSPFPLPFSTNSAPAVFYFGYGALSISYALFLLLAAKLRRNARQQQISHLSGALNGKSALDASKRRRKRQQHQRTKGAYKSLLPLAGSGAKEREKTAVGGTSLQCGTSSSDEDDGNETVDLEMESIGEEEGPVEGQKRSARMARGARIVTMDSNGSSSDAEDLV